MDKLTNPILADSEISSAKEIEEMIQVLMSELGAFQYKITVETNKYGLEAKSKTATRPIPCP